MAQFRNYVIIPIFLINRIYFHDVRVIEFLENIKLIQKHGLYLAMLNSIDNFDCSYNPSVDMHGFPDLSI